jgi:hypothetical protein
MKLQDVLIVFGMVGFMGLCLWLGDNGYGAIVGAIGLVAGGVFLFAAQVHAMRSSRIKRGR